MIVECKVCGKNFNKKPNQIKLYPNHYCSKVCNGIGQRRGKEFSCTTCGKTVWRSPKEIAKSVSGNFFCSQSCSVTWTNKQDYKTGKNHPNYKNGFFSNRSKIKREKPKKCERYGYDEHPEILQVHHKDRNRSNNEEKNLELLCPNCHFLEHYEAGDLGINKDKEMYKRTLVTDENPSDPRNLLSGISSVW